MTIPIGADAYNKYRNLPNYSYNAISLLMQTNELIWKLLLYDDPDAWKDDSAHPNLTQAQKAALIFSGEADETLFRVFMDTGQPDAWVDQATLIRISPYVIYPTNRTLGVVSMMFEVYSHYRINTLSNYTTRVDTITQQFLEVFNGGNVGGLGLMFFDKLGSFDNKLMSAGQSPFKGKWLIMSNSEASRG